MGETACSSELAALPGSGWGGRGTVEARAFVSNSSRSRANSCLSSSGQLARDGVWLFCCRHTRSSCLRDRSSASSSCTLARSTGEAVSSASGEAGGGGASACFQVGVAAGVVGVRVGLGERVAVRDRVGLGERVTVGERVRVGVRVGTDVRVGLGVRVGVAVPGRVAVAAGARRVAGL